MVQTVYFCNKKKYLKLKMSTFIPVGFVRNLAWLISEGGVAEVFPMVGEGDEVALS